MVESREIYHPLAWTPREAYRFLQDIPVFEESGLVVRVPDWWKLKPPASPGGQRQDRRPQGTADLASTPCSISPST